MVPPGEPGVALEALAKAQARAPADESDLWLHIGEAFLAMKSVADAEACRERAVQIGEVRLPVLCLDAHIHQVSFDGLDPCLVKCKACKQSLASRHWCTCLLREDLLLYSHHCVVSERQKGVAGITDSTELRCVQVKGEWKEALLCCENALAIKPGGPDASFRMGTLYQQRKLTVDDNIFAIVSLLRTLRA